MQTRSKSKKSKSLLQVETLKNEVNGNKKIKRPSASGPSRTKSNRTKSNRTKPISDSDKMISSSDHNLITKDSIDKLLDKDNYPEHKNINGGPDDALFISLLQEVNSIETKTVTLKKKQKIKDPDEDGETIEVEVEETRNLLDLKKLQALLDSEKYKRLQLYLSNPETLKKPHTIFRNLVMNYMLVIKQSSLPDVFRTLNEIFPKFNYSVISLDNIYPKYVRNQISFRFGKDSPSHLDSKELLRIDYDLKGKLLQDAKDKRAAKNKDTLVVDAKIVPNAIKANIDSEDPYSKAVALLLASGVRPIELFSKSTFSKVPSDYESKIRNKSSSDVNDPEKWIKQTGLAKKRDPSQQYDVIKPLLFLTADEFLKGVDFVRKTLIKRHGSLVETKKEDAGQLNSTVSAHTRKRAQEIFNKRDRFTLYISRGLYATLSYELIGRGQHTIFGNSPSQQTWINQALGHDPNDQSTSLNYSWISFYNLPGSSSSQEVFELLARQDELETKVEELEERLGECKQLDHPSKRVKTEKYDSFAPKIKKMYDDYSKDKGRKPNQTQLENIPDKVAPRAVIREWYRRNVRTKPSV